MKYFLILFFIFLIPFSFAITSTAQLKVENFKPAIEFINPYVNDDDLIVRITVIDPNGFDDIKSVEVTIISPDEDSFTNTAELTSFSDEKAQFEFTYSFDDTSSKGIYKVNVRVSDFSETVKSSSEFKYPSDSSTPTGLAVFNTSGDGNNFFLNIWDWFKSLFS